MALLQLGLIPTFQSYSPSLFLMIKFFLKFVYILLFCFYTFSIHKRIHKQCLIMFRVYMNVILYIPQLVFFT